MEQLKVLVVDDEPGIRSGIKRILRKFTVDYPFLDEAFSYSIIEAGTGEEAIEIIDNKPPDIILLDNKLPGMEGIDVLEYINKKQYDIQVMMITSYASLELAVKATENGAYDFISKPFTPQELKTSIENVTKHLFLLRTTRQMTEEGKQIRFQFLSVLSHEMKAPLNAIEGYLNMMKKKEFGDKIEDYETIINRTIKRAKGMRHLILDLLDFTKIETGKKRKLEEVDLTDIAKTSIDTMLPYAIQRDIKIELHSSGNVKMLADAKEIEIVYNNLVSNAIKYNKDKGRVDIYVDKKDDSYIIKVADTGLGMTEEDVSKLFNEFFRVKTPNTKNISGSGLGLSIVKKITDLYGGNVKVESEPDKGSTFTVELKDATPTDAKTTTL